VKNRSNRYTLTTGCE